MEVKDPLKRYIKRYPEDFIVKEILPFELSKESKKYTYYKLKKKNKSTLEAIEEIGRTLEVPLYKIGFAGLKDKSGITSQYISIEYGPPRNAYGKGWELKFIGYHDYPLEIGKINKNLFIVTIRDFENREKIREAIEFVRSWGFVNYFGEQRFLRAFRGQTSIGKLILENKIEEALKFYLTTTPNPHMTKRLEKLYGKWDLFLQEATHLTPREKAAVKTLKRSRDILKAFRALPKNVKLMLIFSYQSYLWNKLVKILVSKHFSHFKVPFVIDKVLYFYNRVNRENEYLMKVNIPYISEKVLDYEIPKTIKEEMLRIIEAEELDGKLNYKVANVKFFNEGERAFVVLPEGLEKLEENRRIIRLKFTLPTGSYGTVLLRKIIFWRN
ncbi:MAG: tRNA pseudouridine(13) synthase TruD [candidate division WOR-3 bacterium]